MSTDPVLEMTDVRFGWTPHQRLINIAEFSIQAGKSLFLRGPSGSGKSTLLGLIGGVITPQSGHISITGTALEHVSRGRRDQIRADHLGIIFQQFNLLPYLDVVQNILLPCQFSQHRKKRVIKASGSVIAEAFQLAEGLGLSDQDIKKPVGELSVGQQQRVAVARALIGGPELIIADEPTSALDYDNRDKFIALLNAQRAQYGSSLLFVSHDASLAPHFDKEIELSELNMSTSLEEAS